MASDFKVNAIVIRYANYKDYHRMLKLFSVEQGIISVSAPACRRPKSPLRASSELFVFGEFLIKTRNSNQSVTSVDIIDVFYDLRLDIVALSCAVYMRDFCESVLDINEESPEIFALLIRCLSLLCHDKVDPVLVRCAFEVRIMKILGLGISLDKCINCDNEIKGNSYISVEDGGIVCNKCTNIKTNLIKANPAAINVLKQIIDMPLDKIKIIKLNDKNAMSIEKFWPQYIRWHIDRSFASAKFMDKSRDFEF